MATERLRLSMRQVHKAGEKLFVDYSGKKPEVVNPASGVVRAVELFVAVLGASNYTYVEAKCLRPTRVPVDAHGQRIQHRVDGLRR